MAGWSWPRWTAGPPTGWVSPFGPRFPATAAVSSSGATGGRCPGLLRRDSTGARRGSRRLRRDHFSTRHRVPVALEGGELRLEVLVDRGLGRGVRRWWRHLGDHLALPEAGATGLALLSEGGASRFEDVQVRPLGS